MLGLLNRRVILLSVLAIASAISGYYYVKANNIHKTIIPAGSVFYTPGQRDNCKWVVHISNQITTEPGDNSSTQIGIPEIITDGYIAGILQNGPGNSLLFALLDLLYRKSHKFQAFLKRFFHILTKMNVLRVRWDSCNRILLKNHQMQRSP